MKLPTLPAFITACPPLSPRWALAGLALAAASAAFALWAMPRAEASARALATAQAALASTRVELAEAREVAAALQEAMPRWKRLESAGALQPPPPAQWAATVTRVLQHRSTWRAPTAEFIEARALGTEAGAGHFPLTASTLALHLPLVHEGHLPELLAAVLAMPDALVHARGCRVERRMADPIHADTRPGLFARCELGRITVDATATGSTR